MYRSMGSNVAEGTGIPVLASRKACEAAVNSISTWIIDTEILSGGDFRLPSKQWLEFIRNAVN